ncbi:MAG: GNAT family N-acetyltransferase [Phototrophicaceae bacterium]
MIYVIPQRKPEGITDGMRPVDLKTDLAPLADLIELVFASNMDSGGRAALREMRYLSRIGPGLHLLSHLNEMAAGISLGYVWLVDGRIVGNVSVYPAHWPQDMGSAWIVANVGVHPQYQRRGIARRLMEASMEMIRQRGGKTAILQVDATNDGAHQLYRSLGFVDERTWITWRRPGSTRLPDAINDAQVFIRRRRRAEWRDEMALAARLRPQGRGGLGWLRPLHRSFFQRPWWRQMLDWISLRGLERQVIAAPDDGRLLASMWLESTVASRTQVTLLVDPLYQGIYDGLLLNTAVRRYGHNPIVVEHPADETLVNETLANYRFIQQRAVIHMRWDID